MLFSAALAAGVIGEHALGRATLVVALSMAVSPMLFALSERFVVPRLKGAKPKPRPEAIEAAPAPVVIAGFGRMGQIVGRVLRAKRIAFNALDDDADAVETIRRFGQRVFFGDPTRIEMLRAVGADRAKVLVVTLDDQKQTLSLVERAQTAFPNLRIYARARNRRHAHLLMDYDIAGVVRETYFSSLRLTELVLRGLDLGEEEAARTVRVFRERDEKALILQRDIYEDESKLIQNSKEIAAELQSLFEEDTEEA